MGIKSILVKPFAKIISKSVDRIGKNAVADQEKIRKELIAKAKKTKFGKDHHFESIQSYEDFKNQIPIRDYEGLRTYVECIIDNQEDILWPGKPKYFAKTSGTTSGLKYIPLTKDSISNHIDTARNALMNYVSQSGNSSIFDGKMIFLSGAPTLNKKGGIDTGRLSGIVNHEIPSWIQKNKLPKYETNCIEDWNEKVVKLAEETKNEDLRVISGIPPWVQMYFEVLLEITGKETIMEVFPNLSLFMYGGVNYAPYAATMEALIGKKLDCVEVYPASEGFIAFQDQLNNPDLLLNTNSGIFFEFIPVSEFGNEDATRLSLKDVEIGVNYVIILNNNAGLWGYNVGDTVKFVSIDPHRLVVSGRIKHFISAFGEHVIGKEVEEAIKTALQEHGGSVSEFTVAPQVTPEEGTLPYHEWFVEFEELPKNLDTFCERIDELMTEQNLYYADLINGKILRPAVIRVLEKGAFRKYMASQGKLGGQNKVPRLTNDRKIADLLKKYNQG